MRSTGSDDEAGPGSLAGFDGTTGRSDHGGRRTYLIQLLRDSPAPLSVSEVAERLGAPLSTIRVHLEALADAGLAVRTRDSAGTPGRPRVLYRGVLPNQTHERAQGYRLLAEQLVGALAELPDGTERLTRVGRSWGEVLGAVGQAEPTEGPLRRLVAKLDALWFAPELVEAREGSARLVLHHCPLIEVQQVAPEAVRTLVAAVVDGIVTAQGSPLRVTEVQFDTGADRCAVELRA
ncbi:helix-turn-helix transcriptional regulator [Cellulomonas denverensis]|uniref:Helix-turn-helix domain-containing protein n=1 Tax=Cellulomonas denverensis TaxID=264297 RepID=A0A7X6KSV2_9CELL|nr:helix-turn-helix domain-containing protein [Cellulomonas denverensis]NKY21666.1 helix-turn-helix domain-containing protein [Cellulomonas denverensis]